MQNNILIRNVAFCLLLAAFLSCVSKRPLSNGNERFEKRLQYSEKMHALENVRKEQSDFTTFSGRSKGRILINKDTYDVVANIRMERGAFTWISITALMGIEVARLFITPDSVKIMNRLKSEYVSKSFDYLTAFTSNDLGFMEMQDLLIGNVISKALGNPTEVWNTNEGFQLRGGEDEFLFAVQLNQDYQVITTFIRNEKFQQHLTATYSEYMEVLGYSCPRNIALEISGDDLHIDLNMVYTSMVFDSEVQAPFNIPARYKEIQ